MSLNWYEAVAYVLMGEIAYAYARYMVGTARDRRAFYDAVMDYSVTAAFVWLIGLVVNEVPSIAQYIAQSIGLRGQVTLPSDVGKWPGAVMNWFREAWVNYATWILFVEVLKALGSTSCCGFSLGFLYAIGQYLDRVFTNPYSIAMDMVFAELAFAYAIAWVVLVMTNYGLIALAQLLIVPRSTRFIGATLLAIYVTSVVILVIYSIIIPHYVLPLTAWYTKFIPNCAWVLLRDLSNPTALVTYVVSNPACVVQVIMDLVPPISAFGQLVTFFWQFSQAIFQLMAWATLMAIGYALTEGVTYGLAELIDEGVVRVRLRR